MIDELLDIVDEHDQIIGQKYRTEIYEQKLNNFRVINAFLINDRQEIWIPLRSAHKKLFPSCLDASVGGHVIAGESYQQALERESSEELNIEVAKLPHRLLAKLTPSQHHVSAYTQLYLINTNRDPAYNQDDFASATWVTISELQEKINSGRRAKSDLPILVAILQKSLFI